MLFKIYSGFSLEANLAWLALQTAPAFLSFNQAQDARAGCGSYVILRHCAPVL